MGWIEDSDYGLFLFVWNLRAVGTFSCGIAEIRRAPLFFLRIRARAQ